MERDEQEREVCPYEQKLGSGEQTTGRGGYAPRRLIRLAICWLTGAVVVALLIRLGWQAEGYHRLRGLENEKATGLSAGVDIARVFSDALLLAPAVEKASPADRLMIARTASLTIVAKDFEAARGALERIVSQRQGYIAELTTTSPKEAARTLAATLRIPAPQLNAALGELKALGRVEQETQAGEEVTKQYTDLVARLKNSRATEQRLVDILRQRPGKVSEVLEVEQEIARVRGEIEQMEADRKSLETRVQFAIVKLQASEEYKAQLQVTPTSTGTRLRNALVGGYRDAAENAIGLVLFLLGTGPALLLWLAVLYWPARFAWRRWRPALPAQ